MLLHAQLLFYYPRNLIVSVVHSGLLLVIVPHKKAAILSQVGIFLMSSKRGTELLSPNCQVECVCFFYCLFTSVGVIQVNFSHTQPASAGGLSAGGCNTVKCAIFIGLFLAFDTSFL